MRDDASPIEYLNRYPVTISMCLLALAGTATWWTGGDVTRYMMTDEVWDGEIWRLVSSIFPHVGALHLVFNLAWTWQFGMRLEQGFRRNRFLGIVLSLVLLSTLSSYVFNEYGVGLSGVVYGYFGFLWVVSKKDTRFYDCLDGRVKALFVGWFFLCIVLTWANILNIGNVAHGSGFVFGVCFGLLHANLIRKPLTRYGPLAAACTLLVAGVILRSPWVGIL